MLTFKVCVPLSAWVKPGLQKGFTFELLCKVLRLPTLLLQLGNPFQEKWQSQLSKYFGTKSCLFMKSFLFLRSSIRCNTNKSQVLQFCKCSLTNYGRKFLPGLNSLDADKSKTNTKSFSLYFYSQLYDITQ